MSPLTVTQDERGAVRVFEIDPGEAGGGAANWTRTKRRDWALPEALGVETLGTEDVQVFAVSDLTGSSLRGLLSEGYGIGAAALWAASAELDGARGIVAVIRSAAIADKPVVLTPGPGIRLLGLFQEPGMAPLVGNVGTFESARRQQATQGEPRPPEDMPEPEDDGARLLETIAPSREAYIRSHLWLGAAAMGGATAVLYLIGNPDFWVGAVAGVAAIGIRGLYLASEELGMRWELTETVLRGRSGEGRVTRVMALSDVAQVRRLGSAVQLVSKSGDKLLLKYMGAPEDVQERLARAAKVRPG